MMTAADVLQVTEALSDANIPFWLDGGWGVDALLGEETRDHDDLDVVVRLDRADEVITALAALGFTVTLDDRPIRFVLADELDRRIDFHPVVFDKSGDALQLGAGVDGGDAPYPAQGFGGEGVVAGRRVPCLAPELLVRHHLGYPPQDKDHHNVRLLCKRFGIPVPRSYGVTDQ